ncbi:Helix-turn-helix [Aureimonas phyllosphaerae]|nr:Helix-turn-helix [Aureimonas phyllosphaerae]
MVAVALSPGLPIDGVACRGARAMLGVSQLALAEAADCGRNLLNDFENGVRVPRVGNAVRIREALEELGALFMECRGRVAVGVDPEVASKRTPRARALGGS